jgi:DNA-binding NtrC family response regulator
MNVNSQPHDDVDGHRGIVLVADDDYNVRNLVCRYLEDAGYETLSAFDGEDALRILHASVRPINLLVCDMCMPGMQGPDLAELADGKHPGIGVLFITGSEPPLIPEHRRERWDYMLKPLKQTALARKVRAMTAVK